MPPTLLQQNWIELERSARGVHNYYEVRIQEGGPHAWFRPKLAVPRRKDCTFCAFYLVLTLVS